MEKSIAPVAPAATATVDAVTPPPGRSIRIIGEARSDREPPSSRTVKTGCSYFALTDTMSTSATAATIRRRYVQAVTGSLSLTLRNELSEIRRLAEALDDFAEAQSIPPGAAMRMTLVLDELLTNTINYGYPDRRKGEIRIEAARQGDRVEIAVSDDGAPFDPLQREAPDVDADIDGREVGGLGIHLVVTMADVSYVRRDERNVVTLSLPVSA